MLIFRFRSNLIICVISEADQLNAVFLQKTVTKRVHDGENIEIERRTKVRFVDEEEGESR